MLETKDILNHLESLTKLDIDAVSAYSEAIERIDLPEVKQRLMEFRSDHERHVTDLSDCIQRLGGTAPKRTPDLKGFFLQGFTAVRSMTGNEGALKAMKSNEELTNKTYDKSMQLDLPEDIKSLIMRNRDDERRHLQYIENCISQRVWEGPTRTVA